MHPIFFPHVMLYMLFNKYRKKSFVRDRQTPLTGCSYSRQILKYTYYMYLCITQTNRLTRQLQAGTDSESCNRLREAGRHGENKEIMFGLNFCKSCACYHNLWKFICATVLLCLENAASLNFSTVSGFYSFFFFLPPLLQRVFSTMQL